MSEKKEERGIIKYWRKALGLIMIYLSLMFVVGMSEFMYEEAAQASTPYICKDAIKFSNSGEEITNALKVCMNAYNIQEQIVNQGELFTNTLGWTSPLNYQAYKSVWIAYRSALKINRELLPLVAANTQDYIQESTAEKKTFNKQYSYEYQVIEINQNKVSAAELQNALKSWQEKGYHIDSSYQKIVNKVWFTVFVLEKIAVIEICG